ncbi:MAG: lysoplasmalogenase family protein [Defluviitaleaceae bacterium]|nr:lysoplasmalogenase family protein [Defluviitaleaceae bacterium]
MCRNKRDWAWLAGAMAFTVTADFFLVLHDAHVPGVAVFCFAHVCYMMRACPLNGKRIASVFVTVALAAAITVSFNGIIVLAGLYAFLFGLNIRLHIKRRKTVHNGLWIVVALVLFVLCDLSVLLYNVPRYAGGWPTLEGIFPLIWLFYVPSQGLLAVSAIDSERLRRSEIHG